MSSVVSTEALMLGLMVVDLAVERNVFWPAFSVDHKAFPALNGPYVYLIIAANDWNAQDHYTGSFYDYLTYWAYKVCAKFLQIWFYMCKNCSEGR